MRVENPGIVLEEIVTGLKSQLKRITELESKAKKGDGWSKKEILGHLIDSALINHQRFVRSSFTGSLTFETYSQDNWVEAHLYQEMNWKDLIEIWYRYNTHLAFFIQKLPAEILYHETTDHNFHEMAHNKLKQGAKSSLAYIIWDYVAHMEHHIRQILSFYKPEVIEPY